MKSEKLKKLESELKDLKQWLNLGLVPKKEITKHKAEIKAIENKIKEEEARLKFLKESGEGEEYVAPKRPAGKQVYSEPQTLPDMDIGGEQETAMEPETFDMETTIKESTAYREEDTVIGDLEEDPFSDKKRWERGVLEDPYSDDR